jgi:hypothetical protein
MNRLRWVSIGPFLLVVAALNGCNGVNLLQGIRLSSTSAITLGVRQTFVLEGKGTCQSVDVDWGDGTIETNVIPVSGQRIEFETSNIETRYLLHSYTGWGGGKTVTVKGNGCEGTVRGRFNADPSTRAIGWAQPAPAGTTGACQTSPGMPAMIARMLVKISVQPISGIPGINFGCFAGGCVYDPDGRPGTVAPASFPFPGLREYSVVFRVGSQVVQGGRETQFTTTAAGPLEFCLNDGDNDLTNNAGGLDVTISVDQLGPVIQ